MSASHAADFSGGSHHDALLGLRDLPFLKDRYTVEYLWLGGNDGDLRSKTKTLEGPIRRLADLPSWNYDGSSTNQAPGIDSEVILVPRAIFRDPFRATPADKERHLRDEETASGADVTSASKRGPQQGPAQAALASVSAALRASAPPLDDSKALEDGDDLGAPVLGGCRNLLVMCDTYTPQGDPLPSNTRAAAARIFSLPHVAAEEPWFGIEQEYTLLDAKTRWPLGWPSGGFPAPQGPSYCGVGSDYMYGRAIAEAHYRACHYAGVDVSGLNAEVMPAQWEFQVGPCVGVSAGDQLWVARYILQRVCELTGSTVVTLDPKPVPGDWNGAGAHTNYSTRSMRERHLGGMREIERAVGRLKNRHDEHIAAYGSGNERRLTGKHETAAMSEFTWGIADRGASVRVGNETYERGCGYMEDRRPSANCDPYVVTMLLAKTTLDVSDEEALAGSKEHDRRVETDAVSDGGESSASSSARALGDALVG